MTRGEYEALPRRKQLSIIRHMAVATTAAMRLTNVQVERMINGYFDALDCNNVYEAMPRVKAADKCAACRAGWTAAPKRGDL